MQTCRWCLGKKKKVFRILIYLLTFGPMRACVFTQQQQNKFQFSSSLSELSAGHCWVPLASFVGNTGIKMRARGSIQPFSQRSEETVYQVSELLINMTIDWSQRSAVQTQHQMPIVNPQVWVSHEHLACCETSQFLQECLTEDPPWRLSIPSWGGNSLQLAALSSLDVRV